MIQKLFNFPKLHTMHGNGDETLASFPDIHKDLALNNKLKRPLGYTPGIFSAKPAWMNYQRLVMHCTSKCPRLAVCTGFVGNRLYGAQNAVSILMSKSG